ncbi:hypothetical protein [Campylobacter lanienae]|uniref:hypothetical protein n=1 Tax=Campylobacter lanienae TaxID=75658 RepID=UPI00242ED53B|nr:hypothetical protein [Campylobacter lanienae]
MRATIIAVFMVILVGCGGSSSVLTLKDYTPTKYTYSPKKVTINSIIDTRSNRNLVATITDSKGNLNHSVILDKSLKDIFANSLNKELEANGVIKGSDIVVDIEIAQFSANLSGYSGENLKGQSKVIIKIQKGDTTTTKTISQLQSKYTPLPIASAFEPFINDMLNDMVLATSKAILAN